MASVLLQVSRVRGGGGALPGGHTMGQMLFYVGGSQTTTDGALTHGEQGEVVGEATVEAHKGKGLAMRFPSNESPIDCPLTMLSTSPPSPLPGGYFLGQTLYFISDDFTAPNGERVVQGQQGEVVGPATVETHKGKGLAMRFAGNKGNLACLLTELSPSPLMQVNVRL